MKTRRLVFVMLLVALFITPLFCVNSSLFSSSKPDHSRAFPPLFFPNSKDRPLDFDMSKAFYMPEDWVYWYRLASVGCTSMTEEDWENSAWVMAYDTDIVLADGKPVMATQTDYTENPAETIRYEYTYTANSQDQPATITSSFFSNNQWNYDKRQTYSYNADGGITQVFIEEYYNGGGWVPIEQATCVSNMDRLTDVIAQEYNFDLMAWENSMHMSLTWTGDQVNEVLKQDWTGSAWQNSERTQFAYAVGGEIYRVTQEDWLSSPGTWLGTERHTFTFENGLWTEELIEDYDSGTGWVAGWKGIMSYNNLGYPVTQMGYEWENNSWAVSERMSFYYDGSDVSDDSMTSVPLVILNYPNPFIGSTTVTFRLPQSAQTELGIYNIRGQLVRRLVNETKSAGQHTVTWDGKDDSGKPLASGMYLCRISAAGKQQTHKMLLMK